MQEAWCGYTRLRPSSVMRIASFNVSETLTQSGREVNSFVCKLLQMIRSGRGRRVDEARQEHPDINAN